MAKLGSMQYQLMQRMNSMTRFGESKHQAKQDYRRACEANGKQWNPARAEGIFSYKTFDAYKQTGSEFIGWLKDNNQGVKDLNAITKDQAMQYLQHRQEQGHSAWTVSKDMAAINKVFGFDISKKGAGLASRSYKNVTRSREPKAMDGKVNLDNYKDQITFAKACGCRRQSVCKVIPDNIVKDANGTAIAVQLKEKGGKERVAPILQNYQGAITAILEGKPQNEPIFDKYPIAIDNHAFRAEYARERYQELIQQRDATREQELYRGYDKKAIREVSQDLGHNRLSVVVEHYMR